MFKTDVLACCWRRWSRPLAGRPDSGTGGGGPVGASGSGRWAAPQLGQRLVVSLSSAPQFSQTRLPTSDNAGVPSIPTPNSGNGKHFIQPWSTLDLIDGPRFPPSLAFYSGLR